MIKSPGRENAQGQATFPNPKAPKNNHFYGLPSRNDQDISQDMVIGMLKLLSFEVYALLDPGAMFSFMTPLVAVKFDLQPYIL